ncbi:hypothetical protein MKX03_019658, partial [Papaver bracteatum]
LFHEIPETTTVGSLKRTIIEAVTLEGLCVVVVVKGNKLCTLDILHKSRLMPSESPLNLTRSSPNTDAEPEIFGDSLYPPVTSLENFIDSETTQFVS